MLTSIGKAEQLGYWFSPPEFAHAPGGNRLDVVLYKIPASGMFCTQRLDLSVKSGANTIGTLKIHHPWSFERMYQVCAGRIEIIDDKGERFDALTLGGRLQIDTQERFTACTLESPAPVLVITGASPIEVLFVDEIRILLAERRAKQLADPSSYEEHLINADPLELYISLIEALIEKMEHTHHIDNTQIMKFLNFIHIERKRLKVDNLTPLYVPPLEEIL